MTDFEPRHPWADRIEANVAANDLDAAVRRVALAPVSGEASCSVDDVARLDPATTGAFESAATGVPGEFVETFPGDEYVRRTDATVPAAVKIDVEGAEVQVLRGMRETLTRPSCRLVYCEVHPSLLPTFGASENEPRSLLDVA